MHTYAIIGAGYSGALMAVELAQRLASKPAQILLFEKREECAQGAAYSTTRPEHLLNVNAGGMSAFAKDPDHFVRWLAEQGYDNGQEPLAGRFMPRQVYGQYLQGILTQTLAHPPKAPLHIHQDEIIALEPQGNQWKLHTQHAQQRLAHQVILAHGNPPPANRWPHLDTHKHYITNPWHYKTIANIPPHAQVLIIGTGLTMVDNVISLLEQGHQGKIAALSRRGLWPRCHEAFAMMELSANSLPETLNSLTKHVRGLIKANPTQWRGIIQGLRPHTQTIWQALSLRDKRRFMRHLMPYWDVHRHRIASSIYKALSNAQKKGQLNIAAARIDHIDACNKGFEVWTLPRREKEKQCITANYLINCTGPQSNYRQLDIPLIQALLNQGIAQVDETGISLKVSADSAIIDAQGKAFPNLFALGPATKSRFWEMIAVPDIREQIHRLGQLIIR